MDWMMLFSFIGASALLALMPGPDNVFVLTESMTRGHRTGYAISTGLSLGVLIHTTAAATGLSLLVYQSAVAFQLIKYAGAGYMLFLAIKALKEKPVVIEGEMPGAVLGYGKLIRKGFLMNILNPKVSLFFIAFLPQFVTQDGWPVMGQMLVLGLVFMLVSFLIFCVVSRLSGKLSPYLSSARFWNITKYAKATVLTLLSVTLALSKQ